MKARHSTTTHGGRTEGTHVDWMMGLSVEDESYVSNSGYSLVEGWSDVGSCGVQGERRMRLVLSVEGHALQDAGAHKLLLL